jgi:hypothetical protein
MNRRTFGLVLASLGIAPIALGLYLLSFHTCPGSYSGTGPPPPSAPCDVGVNFWGEISFLGGIVVAFLGGVVALSRPSKRPVQLES